MRFVHPHRIVKKIYPLIGDISSMLHRHAIKTFVQRMNDTAQRIGMTNSLFTKPSGLPKNGAYSVSCARDLSKLAAYAMNYPALIDAFKFLTYDICLKDKTETVESTFITRRVSDYAMILLGKTGSGRLANNLAFVVEVDGEKYACSIMMADSEDERFDAMVELIAILHNHCYESHIVKAQMACAYKLEFINGRYQTTNLIYEQDADLVNPTMSVAKLLTMIVAIDNGCVMDKICTVLPCDISYGVDESGAIFRVGDKVRLYDLFMATYLPSSCQAANVIARKC